MNSGASNGGAGGSIQTAALASAIRPPIIRANPSSYLDSDVMRPDLYEDRALIARDIHAPRIESRSRINSTIWYTIGIIVLSAIIFITFIAWADVLKSYIDSKVVNEVIGVQTKSNIIYAILISIVSLLILTALGFLYVYFLNRLVSENSLV